MNAVGGATGEYYAKNTGLNYIGANAKAAHLSGIPVDRMLIAAFGLSAAALAPLFAQRHIVD